MYQLIIFAFSLFFSNTYTFKPESTAGAKPIDTVKVVNAIKVQYAAIDAKRKTYAQYEAEFQGNSTEGALFTGFYAGTALKMINGLYFGDLGKTESDHYVNETGIFFIYSKVYEYMSPLSVDPKGATKSITENWYYFYNEELIKWVRAGKVVPSGSAEFGKKRSALKDELKTCKKLFSNFSSLKKIK